MRDLIWDVID